MVNLGGASATVTWATATTGFNGKILILGAPTATHTVDLQNPIDLGNAGRQIKVDKGSAVVDAKLSGNLTGIAGGNLNKTSGGTLVLTGTNDYLGTTTVSGGTLLVNGTHTGSGAITVGATAALGGSGTLAGAVTANVGDANNPSAAIKLIDAAVGTLNLGSTLTFNGSAAFPNNLNFDLGNGGGGTDKVVVTGKVTATTANGMVIHLNQLAGGAIDPGTYPLIQGGATSTGTGYKLATTRSGGNLYTLDTFASDTQSVTVAAGDSGSANDFAYWQGDTAVWNTAQWYSDSDGTITDGAPGYNSNVRFGTTSASNLATTLGQDYEINSLTVDAGLTATSISGNMLTIDATGANSNTAGNGITVNNAAGTTLASKVGLGSSQTWTVGSAAALTVSGEVSDFGAGHSLTKAGAGTLTLTGGTSFSGSLAIADGTLAIGGASRLGDAAYYGNIVNNGTFSFNSSTGQAFYGAISGTGQFTKSGGSQVSFYGPNTYSGGTVIDGGTLYVSAAYGGVLPPGNVTINAAGTLSGEQANMAGSLTMNGGKWFENNGFGGSWTGPVNLTATSTFQTRYYQTVIGNITGVGGLIKAEVGTLSFNSTGNNYDGPTLVSAGTLSLAKPEYLYNADTSKWTPENITVNSGAKLVLNVGGATDFTGPQLSNLFTNLGTVNNNGLKAGAAVGFDTTNAGANVVDITGDIVDSVGTGGGKLSVNKYGNGTLRLSGDNTYSGPTFIQVGYLSIDSFNSVTTNGGLGTVHAASSSLGAPTTVADGTINMSISGVAFNNGFIYNGTGETTDRVINLQGGSPANLYLTQSGTGLLKFTSAFTSVGSNSGNFGIILQGSTEGTGEIPFVIPQFNSKSTTIYKRGTGTWTLSNANTYGGVTSAEGGALVLTDANALPGGLGVTGGTSALTFNGGVIGLGAGDFTRSLAAANTVTGVNFNNTAGGWAAYGADRTVNLGGASASITWATANTGFNNRVLILGNATATHTVTLENPLNLTNGARNVQADDGAAIVDGELSGDITGVAGGNLNKIGLGTLALTGTNNYAGTTNINAGTLLIDGANSGTGTVNVMAAGRLGGNGSTAAPVTVASGGKLLLDISDWDGAAGSGFTDLDVASLNLTGVTWTADISSATSYANFTETTKTFPFLTASGSITGFDAGNVTITPDAGFTGTGTWSIQQTVNTLELVYTSEAASPYDVWAAAKGLDGTAGKENGVADDPDHDGRNNLSEFAFNGDPLSGSDNGKIFVLSEDSDFDSPDTQKELILTVAVRAGTPAFSGSPSPTASQDGISYTIEGSLTLNAFDTAVNVVPTPVTLDGATPLPAAGSGYEYRSFSLSGSNGLPSAGFLRAKVTQP